MRTHLCRNSLLDVPPTYRMRTHLVQQWPSRFCCDPFVPVALSGHFRSELRLLNPETLEHTHQGIVRNGKQFKTHAKVHQSQNQGIRTLPGRVYAQLSVYRVKKALSSRPIPAFLDLPFISSVHAAAYTYVIIRKVFLGLQWGQGEGSEVLIWESFAA
ncbi:hypothetical protein PIB30_036241 [Stylosanthes scabra]|uniref:Uncharacterized protein n=1 Tax=Stylosanthes scabra TaxID=79078 RepID=A0ABU6WBG0_9FABA|nr:hypothetical protein [Stylosanthes scabra]